MIVLNSLQVEGAGFKGDTNKVTLITEHQQLEFDLKNKKEVANDIFNQIEELFLK